VTGQEYIQGRVIVELARKLPFLAVVMALLTLSVGSLMISQGMVGAQTDPGVGEEDAGGDSGPQLPATAPVDTNPANGGNTGGNAGTALPPAAPIDGLTGGSESGVGTTAAGLPQTGSGGYLDAGSATSPFYMLVSVVAMMGLAGSLVYARARSK
jgi:hypothetical protein